MCRPRRRTRTGPGPGRPRVVGSGNIETAGPTRGLNGGSLSESCGGGRSGSPTAGCLRPHGTTEAGPVPKPGRFRIVNRAWRSDAQCARPRRLVTFVVPADGVIASLPHPDGRHPVRIAASATKRSRPIRRCVRDTAGVLWPESRIGIRPATARTRGRARFRPAGVLLRREGRRK